MRTHQDIENFMIRMGVKFEHLSEGTWVIHDGEDQIDNIVVRHDPPILLCRVKLFDVPGGSDHTELFRMLLELNASEMISGAYGLEGNAVVADQDVEKVHVKRTWLHDAPGFPGDYADKINERMPSYSDWVSMANVVGLKRLFFDEKIGLLSQHPGCAVLESRHLQEVQSAVERFRTRFPEATPRCDMSTEDAHLARLLWVEWWMGWALANCEMPAIYNT